MSKFLFSTLREIAEEAVKELKNVGIPAEIRTVTKDNGVEVLSIVCGDGSLRPDVFVTKSTSVCDLVEMAKKSLEQVRLGKIEDGVYAALNFEQAKAQLRPFVLNLAKNREFIKERDMVYKPFLDLAVGVSVGIGTTDANGRTSIKVNKYLLDTWKTSFENVLEEAINNHRGEMIFGSVSEILARTTGMDVELAKEMDQINVMMGLPVMYCLRNYYCLDGAAYIADEAVLKRVAERLAVDSFYILPSSRHELLIMSNETGVKKFELQDMVAKVNATEVPEADFLSNSVYLYQNGQVKITA